MEWVAFDGGHIVVSWFFGFLVFWFFGFLVFWFFGFLVFWFFGFLVFWVSKYFFGFFYVHRSGVARQPLPFFASPKKGSKERRPRCHCPSGSQLCMTKNGKLSKLAALKQRHFLYPFSVMHNWQCQKWMKVKINNKIKSNGNIKTISIDGYSLF
ncbi:hypothetical protein H8K52_08255 [Undibacterium seohonense]|uniref:Uncharacterized protein n=1 Tax=Undibacterium seohonense TaxID=1344950 RepID=A0ABR6X2Z7_9BURK|nr:hypothetical protein [Undibacterium seohonense]MBC3807334.1 hypothetical protein [Undibacterium seohonense]